MTDVADSGTEERKGSDQETKNHCLRNWDNRGGSKGGQRAKDERGQRKQEERSAPWTTHSKGCSSMLSSARKTFATPATCQVHASAHNTTHRPELYEILQHSGCNEQTVHQGVGQEEDEKLVVGESYTVVHPGDAQVDFLSANPSHVNFQKVITGMRTRAMWIIMQHLNSLGHTRDNGGPSSAHTYHTRQIINNMRNNVVTIISLF